MSTTQPAQQQQQNTSHFGGPDADLAARLAAPVSPTTEKSAAEAQRRTSEWKPPPAQRTLSFDHQEHKRAMMAASGALSGAGPGAGAQEQGFSEGS
ncbi:hypothetical protein N0V93_007697 [Gnomoniopsis smithogilvyi]|uniref:Uncharacterized protein n=1 Tax=Gnomoniopsis smithogilvyi TaxID=1191159 RepID=A0A9W9CU63_9PEZI|nr:hypothetical protein N0V93_007697 [Gnomoniopsis smithogilvyi]